MRRGMRYRHILACALSAAILAGCAGILPHKGHEAFLEGEAAFNANNYPLAEAKYREILDNKLCANDDTIESPKGSLYFCNTRSNYFLALSLIKQEKADSALENLEVVSSKRYPVAMSCWSMQFLLHHYGKKGDFRNADNRIFQALNAYDKFGSGEGNCGEKLLEYTLLYAVGANRAPIVVNYYKAAYYKNPPLYAFPFKKALVAAQEIKELNNVGNFETVIMAPIEKADKIQRTTFPNQGDPAYAVYQDWRAKVYRNALIAAEKKGITGYDEYLSNEAKGALQAAAYVRSNLWAQEQQQFQAAQSPPPKDNSDEMLMDMFKIIMNNRQP